MIALLLLASALADTDVCAAPAVASMRPSAGADDVPLDAQIAIQFDTLDCGQADIDLRLEALGTDGTWTTVHEAQGTGLAGEIITFDVPDLAPDTDHRITITAESEIVTAFRTGLTASTPLQGQPSGVLEDSAFFEELAMLWVRVTPASDPHAPSTIALVDSDDPEQILAWSFTWAPTRLVTDWFPHSETPCVRAAQWDVAGRRLADSAPICVEPEPLASSRCSTSPGTASAALIAMALLALGRRTDLGGLARARPPRFIL